MDSLGAVSEFSLFPKSKLKDEQKNVFLFVSTIDSDEQIHMYAIVLCMYVCIILIHVLV